MTATRSTSGTPPTDKLYTGQQKEHGDSLGLHHYGARVYSTVLAHFLSADPAVASAYDPQSWHAYSYVRNNPLRFVDPTGLKPIDMPGEPNRSQHRPAPSGPTDKQWAESKSIEVHRDTGCDWNCQQLTALAAVGLTYEQWQWVAAVSHAAAQHAMADGWVQSQSMANGGQAQSAIGSEEPGHAVLGFIGVVATGPLAPSFTVALSPAMALGVVILGSALLAPCDKQGCTSDHATDDPFPGARKVSRQGAPPTYVATEDVAPHVRKGDIFVKDTRGGHQGETHDQYRRAGGKAFDRRGVQIKDGKVVPKQPWSRSKSSP